MKTTYYQASEQGQKNFRIKHDQVWNDYFVQGERGINIQSSVWIYTVFSTPFIEKDVFSPMYVHGIFVENQMTMSVCICFWVFYAIPLICVSAFVPVPCNFCYCGSVV
jgi:hypothetical protein